MSKKKSTSTRRAESQAASVRAAAIRKEQERRERRVRVLVVAAVLVVVAVVATLLISQLDKSDQPASSPKGVVGTYGVPAGPSSAPVKVVVYEDFICPFCGQFEAASRKEFQADIDAGKVQFQYHVLNFLDRSSSTQYSTRAANATGVVLEAAGPKVAKKFHDLLFEHQPQEGSAGLTDAQLVDYAVQAGASRSKVSDGISNQTFKQWVANGASAASKDDVTATPTVKINGKALPGPGVTQLVVQVQKAVDAG